MADSFTSAVMVALSIAALLTLLSALRKVKARGEWNSAATFGAVMVASTASCVELFVTYMGKWTMHRNAFKTVTWDVPSSAHQIMRLLALLCAVYVVVVFIIRLKRPNTPVNVPAVFFLLVELVCAESALLHGDNPFRPLSLVFLAVVAVCTVAPRGLGIHIGVGTACLVAAIASGFTFAVQKDFSVFACTSDGTGSDKCGLMGFDFRGIMENGNALAIYLAIAIPFIYIAFGSWEGPVLSGYVLCLIMLTGGRSGMGAGLLAFVVLLVMRPNIRKPIEAPARTRLLYVLLAGLMAVGFAMPYMATDPAAYHGRAGLWILAKAALSDTATLIYGTGVLGWQHVRDSGRIDPSASYSVHNEWLQVLYSSGLIGFVAFLAALGFLIWRARPNYSLVVGCVLVPVFMLGITERPWPIDTSDWMTWAIPAALLCYPASQRRSEQNSPPLQSRAKSVPVGAAGSGRRAGADVAG
ncbi:O-antigen ligase family protein [Mycobacterium parmense]|uniref:O-antigen ligase-related domain-containing protein n=1 Tax=Mycobacterium parmense TaxID=185642 RepID=A0A7I7Z3E4_9MYCO|nr:O-antigen ligase family protein [Mycobacterium parmense]MCV7352092.1 O-antigen ligase family protein [Mycobacterium parmense]ORW56097.1 hypothetical protein AWC20_15290 [Mycobacterium parmense]BBZ48192.1 hypothetical protein MPRM_54730 [Mycobacterium parmense]